MFRDYGNTIWRIALNYTRNAADADDVTQNALIRCLNADKTFEGEEHLRSYIIRVAVNESKRWLTSPWHRLMAGAAAPEEIERQAAALPQPESALYRTLMRLPEKYRLPLYLYYYEDCPAAEIAETLGLTVSGVTTRLARGRDKLKKQLEGVFDDE